MNPRADSLRRLTATIGTGCSYAYAAVFLVTLYEVFARYVFGRPTYWSIEVCSILAGIHYLVSALQAQTADTHIRVETLTSMVKPRVQRGLLKFQRMVIILVCGALSYFAILQAATALQGFERSGTQLNWPVPTILKSLVAVVLVVLVIVTLVQLFARDSDAPDGP